MLALSDNVYVVLAMVNLLMLVLGMFMELVPIMFILAPIVFPGWRNGRERVQFGVVMVLNLMIGMITADRAQPDGAVGDHGRGRHAHLPRCSTLLRAAGGAAIDHLRPCAYIVRPAALLSRQMKGVSYAG
jgi:hypothetical protein